MGRGGRSTILLCAFATLLLISASAVSGLHVENGGELRGFVRRLGRNHVEGELRRAIAHGSHVTEEAKELEKETVVDKEEKPAEGVWEKARSFVSGISTLVGNGIPNPAGSVFRRTKLAPSETEEKSFGRRDQSFGRHHRFRGWAGVRDLIRNHPERIAAAGDISATEPLALEEDVTPVTPGATMLANIRKIVMLEAEDYHNNHALPVETNEDSTCADVLEGQVLIYVKSVKRALLEQCSLSVSTEDQSFCNLVNDHPMMATFVSFWMIDVNPVKVPWHKTSKTAACSSVNSFRDFVKSLKEIEGLARESDMLLPGVIDMENMRMGHGLGHHMFRERRFEHGGRGRHWWHRMWHKHTTPSEEVLDAEDQKRPFWQRFLISKFMTKHSGERHENGDHEKHWWQRSGERHEHGDHEKHWWQHSGERREHGDHERHWWQHEANADELGRHGLHGPHHGKHLWQRFFRMFNKHRHMRHHGFESAQGDSERDVCFHRSAKHLTRGIKHHLATTCQSATAPNVIAACQFAKEHHFLVKTWLAVKMPVFSKAAKICGNIDENAHISGHGIGLDDVVERPVDGEVLASSEAGKTNERHLSTFSRWMSRGCAKHRANREFNKAMHLRGHVVGISSSDNGEAGLRELVRTHLIDNAENALGGHVRTHLIVVEGGNLHHVHDFHQAFHNLKPLHYGSYEEMMTDLQSQVDEVTREREAVSGERQAGESSRTEMMTFEAPFKNMWKPFRHHAKGPHFRISANPRGAENNEFFAFLPKDHIEYLNADESPQDTAENRAVM